MSYSQQFQEHTFPSYLDLLQLLHLKPHPVLLQVTVFSSICIPAGSPGHPSHTTLVPQTTVGATNIWEKRTYRSSQLLGLNTLHQSSTSPAESWTLSMRRGSTQTLLKTSGMPQSILQFLKETFAQTHFEERGPVPQQILNSLRKRISNLCQSRSTHLLSTRPLAAVSTVVASHPRISHTQVLHVPTTR